MTRIAKIFSLAATAALLTAPALAADLPRRSALPDAVYAPGAPAGVWTGFYVGANLGVGFGSRFNNDVGYSLGGSSGVTFGLQTGYDWQIDRFVVGVAGDINYSDIRRRYIATVPPTDVRASMNWSGTLRARLGYAVQDNLLLYGTAGLALGNVRASETLPSIVSQSRTLAGWTAGVGGEYLFTRNVSGLLEYRYTNLARGNYLSLTDQPRLGFEGHQIRTGLNYRF